MVWAKHVPELTEKGGKKTDLGPQVKGKEALALRVEPKSSPKSCLNPGSTMDPGSTSAALGTSALLGPLRCRRRHQA